MESRLDVSKVFVLSLTNDEAEWLMNYMQNPMGDKEDIITTINRNAVYGNLACLLNEED